MRWRSVEQFLSLAASPTFAVMAVVTMWSGDVVNLICSGTSPLIGMSAMYGLMAAFHLRPWLKLIARKRFGRRSHAHAYPRQTASILLPSGSSRNAA
jgi:hypothetical protein